MGCGGELATELDAAEELRECDAEELEAVESDFSASDSSSSFILGVPMMSSEYESGTEVCDGFVVRGRMIIQGGHSFMRSANCGVGEIESHSLSFFTTQGFCVHRSLEK
jgi:hypothetical protein